MSELEEKVEAQSREMEALQTQNNDLNMLVKVSLVEVADTSAGSVTSVPVFMWEVEQGPGNEASRLVHFLSLIPRLLGRAWE